MTDSRTRRIRRPRLKTALLRIARDSRTLQFGIDPRRAVVLADLDPAIRTLIAELDGRHEAGGAIARGEALGIDAHAVRRLLDLLDERDLLEDAAATPHALRALSPDERQRLQPELAALSLRPGTRDGGVRVLSRRRQSRVVVYGCAPPGTIVIALLGAAGVGDLRVADPASVSPQDISPGGLTWKDVGRRREEAAVEAARRVAPSAAVRPGSLDDGSGPPDLVVVCPDGPVPPALVHLLMEHKVPHLIAAGGEGIGTVGPLVFPGQTACLNCMDLYRRDRDPLWPRIPAELGGYPYGDRSTGCVLSTMIAAQAAGQALRYLDDASCSVINATLEAVLPDWRWRRRTWPINPQCRCSANDFHSLRMSA